MPHTYIPLARRHTEEDALETYDGFAPKQPDSAPRGLHQKTKRHICYGLAAVAALILIFAFSAPYSITTWPPKWRPGSNNDNNNNTTTAPPAEAARGCGTSPEEAVNAGCQFDLMSFTWSQPACLDEELTEEFLALKAWAWWVDAAGTEAVSREEVALGGHERLFVSWEYQLEQCVYLWKKMQRAVLKKAPLDSYTLDAEHTAQCAEMLLDRQGPAEETNTVVVVKYPTCSVE